MLIGILFTKIKMLISQSRNKKLSNLFRLVSLLKMLKRIYFEYIKNGMFLKSSNFKLRQIFT